LAETKVWLVWDRDSFVWNKVNLPWNEAYVLEEITGKYKGGAPGMLLEEERPWKSLDQDLEEKGVTEETRDKLLEIIVKVNGLDRKISRLSENKVPIITVEHVRKTLAEVVPDIKVVTNLVKITESREL
jgi:hypothetical protein